MLKVYDDFHALTRNLTILQHLDEMQIPVGTIIPTADQKNYVAFQHKYYFLSRKLTGSNLVSIQDTATIGHLVGETIARLHLAFLQCESIEGLWNNNFLEELNGWVRENFIENGWTYVSSEEFDHVVANLAKDYDKLPVQLIHRDVHFGNFLFDNGNFSGYIDFDLSQKNIRIFDLCYFLLGLLSEQNKFQLTQTQWFDFVRYVFAGYETSLSLSKEEKEAVIYVMEGIELLFVSYFHSIEDSFCAQNAFMLYQFLRKNEAKIKHIVK